MEKYSLACQLSIIFRICNIRIKNESSQGCGPQPCELLALFCKSEAFLIKHFIHRNTEKLEFAEEFPNHIIL